MIKTILHLSDTHGLHKRLGKLPHADVIIHSGDITFGGNENEVIDFLEWFGSLPHRHKIFIAGNHDDCLYQASIEGLPDNIHYLCNEGIMIENTKFYGVPMFVADCLEGIYEKQIRQIPTGTDILITHQPPLGILDFSKNRHYGNEKLLERIGIVKPKYHFFGHIHQAYGIQKYEETICVNSAVVNENYELVNTPQLFKINKI